MARYAPTQLPMTVIILLFLAFGLHPVTATLSATTSAVSAWNVTATVGATLAAALLHPTGHARPRALRRRPRGRRPRCPPATLQDRLACWRGDFMLTPPRAARQVGVRYFNLASRDKKALTIFLAELWPIAHILQSDSALNTRFVLTPTVLMLLPP